MMAVVARNRLVAMATRRELLGALAQYGALVGGERGQRRDPDGQSREDPCECAHECWRRRRAIPSRPMATSRPVDGSGIGVPVKKASFHAGIPRSSLKG